MDEIIKTLTKEGKSKREIYEQIGEILKGKDRESKRLFKCFVCSSTDVEIRQLQTRSADEGITTFMKCNSCGKMKRI